LYAANNNGGAHRALHANRALRALTALCSLNAFTYGTLWPLAARWTLNASADRALRALLSDAALKPLRTNISGRSLGALWSGQAVRTSCALWALLAFAARRSEACELVFDPFRIDEMLRIIRIDEQPQICMEFRGGHLLNASLGQCQ